MSNNANSLPGKEGRNRPRYREIAGDLLDRIKSGDLSVGEILKSEEELGQEFKASRGTIRQSLSLLQELGIILRRQREGTRVISRFPSKGRIDNKQVLEDWARYGTDFPLRISSLRYKDPPPDTDGSIIAGPKWLCITGIRYPLGSTTAFSYCQSYVSSDFAEIEQSLSRTSIPIYAQVEQRYGRVINAVRVALRAVSLPEVMATALDAKIDEPALELTRYYLDATRRTIIISTNTHPADRYVPTIEVERGA